MLPNSGKETWVSYRGLGVDFRYWSVLRDSAVGMRTRSLALLSNNAHSTSYRENKYFSSLNYPDGLWGPPRVIFNREQGHVTRNTKRTVNFIYLQGKCVELYLHSPIRLNCVLT